MKKVWVLMAASAGAVLGGWNIQAEAKAEEALPNLTLSEETRLPAVVWL